MKDHKFNVQVDPEAYARKAFTPTRVISITQQLREICLSKKTNILEVGIGSGILKNFLSNYPQIKHTGFDFDPALKPEVVGPVTDMPFDNNSFELILCCQVLEHIPFEHFTTALKELQRVTTDLVILSLPDRRRHYALWCSLGRHGKHQFDFSRQRRKLKNKIKNFDGEHHWEIGYKFNEFKTIVKKINNAGFKILRNYRLQQVSHHTFFILTKNE